jgi:hypothetical protein
VKFEYEGVATTSQTTSKQRKQESWLHNILLLLFLVTIAAQYFLSNCFIRKYRSTESICSLCTLFYQETRRENMHRTSYLKDRVAKLNNGKAISKVA